MNPLFLMGSVVLLMLWFGIRQNARLSRSVAKHIPGKTYLPQALHVAIMATQLYELVLVVKHTSLVTISAALLLLAIVVAGKSGTEEIPPRFPSRQKTR